MEWLKVCVSAAPHCLESVFAVLLENGVAGAEIINDEEMKDFLETNPFAWDYVDEELMKSDGRRSGIVFYVSANPDGAAQFNKIKNDITELQASVPDLFAGGLEIISETVDDEVWLNEWKKYYKPFKIGRSVVVVPFWEKYEPAAGEIIFTIDPGSVFGTGLHQTTQLCVEALDTRVAQGQSILDIGCGSGILSVVALLLGAGYAFACDFDPASADSAKRNVKLNAVESCRYQIEIGDIFKSDRLRKKIEERKYEIIVANITADAVINLVPAAAGWLARRGIFIASGIIGERLGDVRTAFITAGLRITEVNERDDWFSVCGTRDA